MAFTLMEGARHSLFPAQRRATLTTPQASLHATDRIFASPKGLSTLGFDPIRFQTEPPVCYRASWQLPGPDSHRPATTSLRARTSNYPEPIATPPVLLDALQIRYRLLSRSLSKSSIDCPSTPDAPLFALTLQYACHTRAFGISNDLTAAEPDLPGSSTLTGQSA